MGVAERPRLAPDRMANAREFFGLPIWWISSATIRR
jgi:hypothetical protein